MTALAPTKSGSPKLSEVARHVVVPSGIVTTGYPAVRDKCRDFGVVFDEWQAGLGRLILAKRANGRYAATIGGVVLSIPRQVGKTFTLMVIIFALCILFPGVTVLWTAHRVRTAGETFRTMQGLAKRRRIAPHILTIVRGAGDEAVEFRNGSRILFGARETGFGRGFTEVDIEVFDEAQILSDRALDDMVAATNQSRHPAGALLFFIGTPPRPTDPGEAFSRMRTDALSGESDDIVYVEMSADPDADPDDRKQWANANPSYPQRTPAEAMLRLRKKLTTDSFRREGLGVWDKDAKKFALTRERWDLLGVDVPRDELGEPVFFLTIAKGMGSACITAAARHGDSPHVELAHHGNGTAWFTARIRELHERYPNAPFAAYHSGPVKAWGPTLAESYQSETTGETVAGLELRLLTAPEEAAACSNVQKLAEGMAFTHSKNEVVAESLSGAMRRQLDGGAWKWDWRLSPGDLAPIAGHTGALWLLAVQPTYDALDSVY